MPDVIGVRVGMDAQEAVQILKRQYPRDLYQAMPVRTVGMWPVAQPVNTGYNVLMPNNIATPEMYLSLTAPPDHQVVWRIVRYTRGMHINRATLLAALREKYGKESGAYTSDQGKPSTDDRVTSDLLWLFDEKGARATGQWPSGIWRRSEQFSPAAPTCLEANATADSWPTRSHASWRLTANVWASTPGMVAGVSQVSFQIPDGLEFGPVSVVVSAGEFNSAAVVTIAVK